MTENEFMIELLAELEKSKSKTQINKDIKQLEKVINSLRLTATLAKGTSKKELNQMIRQLESQLNHIKLQAKIDQKNLKSDINKTLNNLSFKDIEIGVTEGKTRLKVQKVIADAKKVVQNNPISLNIELKKDKLSNQLTTYLTKNSKIRESETLLKEADKIREKISSINDSNSLRNATDSFQLFKSEVSATGYATKSTTDKVAGLVKGITKVGSVFGVASLAINNFQKSLNTIKTNDSILTEISKTSNSTKQQIKELGDSSSFGTASKYGQLSSDYLTAVQEMNRSGFYDELGKQLAELSLKVQAAGDVSAEVSQEYLLATNAAYGYAGSVEKLTAVLDGQNFISNKYSVSMEDMAIATQKAGSMAANTGVAIDELSAVAGTIEATTKAASETVGTGIKSLLVNLQNVSSDKITETLEKANASMTTMKNGIEQLRTPIEILKDLAKTYNSLDESDPLKSEITTNIGQKYYANLLSSLLTNWDMYEEMLKTYSEGINSSEIEAQKTADSLQGRLNALQNSWDSLVNSLTNKDTIKGGIGFLDGLIQGAEKLIDTFGEIPVILTSITAGMTAINKDIGITKLFNDDGKFDVQGNFMGIIDFTQIKHFKEAKEAISDWNSELANGVTDLDSFKNKTVQNTAQLREYLSTCSTEAPASLKGYKQHLQAAGESVNSLRIGTLLLNSAISFGLGMAIQGVVTLITDMTQRTDELHNRASELGSEFSNTTSDIDGYKTKISELQEVINDSGSSIEDVTDARKQLMTIQDELIQKYGKEADKVNAITEAINGQADALENLKKAEWYDTKADYNAKSSDDHIIEFVTQTIPWFFEKVMLFGGDGKKELPKSKIENMLDEWNDQEYSLNTTGNEKLDELLEKSLGMSLVDGKFKIGGSVDDLQDKLSRIKETIAGYKVSPEFEESLEKVSSDVQDIYESDSNTHNQTILYDVILSDDPTNVYDELYEKIEEAKNRYDEAILDGDESKISSAADSYAKAVSSAMDTAMENGDFDVADYFENMYPELKQTVGEWQFDVDFEANTNNLEDRVKDSLKTLDGFSIEDFEQFNVDTATQEQIEAFGTLKQVAGDYGLSLEQLLALLQKLGLVQSESYQELVKLFGEDNIKKIAPEDLTFAYKIENAGDMTFEEFQKAIEEAKKEAQEAELVSFSKAWKNTTDEIKDDLLELAKAGELTPETLSSTKEYKELLTQTGLTAEQVTQKINKMVTSADQLASMGSGIKSLSDNLAAKKESPKKAIDYDTLAGMSDELKENTKEWKKYEKIMGTASSTYEECRQATNKLATAFVNSNNFLAKLTDNNKDYYISQLKAMGVDNAEAVVKSVLNNKIEAQNNLEAAAKEAKVSLANATWDEISATNTYITATENAKVAMQKLYVQENILANNDLGIDEKVIELQKFAKMILGVAVASKIAAKAQENMKNINTAGWSTTDYKEAYNTNYIKEFNKEFSEIEIDVPDVLVSPKNYGTSNSNSNKSGNSTKEKETKQIIDWLERRLTRMQSIIDLTASKLQNLFSIKAKNNNLSDQIKQTTKLINQYSVAISRYKAKTKSAGKGLSKDIKNKVKSGEVTKASYSKLVKTYGQEKADKIQNYIDWYDKWQNAKQSKQEQIANRRELKKERNQLYIDQADSKLSMLDAQAEIALNSKGEKSAKATNAVLQKKVAWTKQYYNYQIKNAKLENDTTKVKELQAQKEKALLDIQVEKKQNLADEAEAEYNLNQQYEKNAIFAKDKNKYESTSLKYLKEQYARLIEIAGLEGDTTEQKRLQAELDEKIAASYKTQYDNIKAEYDNKTSLNNAKISTVQAEIAALEANGKVAGEAFYEGLTESTKETKEILLDELADLEAKGANFDYGSPDWYTWQEDIESTTQAIYNCDESLATFQKSWNELKLRKFDLVNKELEYANDHIDFLTDYLSHKDLTSEDAGGLTDEGFATISLDFSKMENNNKIIENAQNGLAELQKQIADGTTKLTEEEQAEAINKYIELIRNAISANEDLKDSVLDLVEEAFTVQLDVLNDLIEKRKKALQTEKDLYDYQRKISNQTKAIATIQKQIAALTGDNSEEARSRLQKLQVELEESKSDLEDLMYDRWLSDQEDMLDDLSEEMEGFFENLMKEPDELLSNIEKAIKEQPEKLASIFAKYGLGDAHSFDTITNEDGSKKSNSIDYGNNSYQNDYDENGVNKNNTYSSTINKDNATGSDNNSSDLKNNFVSANLHPASNTLSKVTDTVLFPIRHTTTNNDALSEQEQKFSEASKNAFLNVRLQRNLAKRKSLVGQNTDFISHYTTGEYGNALNQYLSTKDNKVYTTWEDMKELADILGVKVAGNKVTLTEAKKIRNALQNAGFSQGGIAQFDSGILKKVGEDGIVLARNGEGFVRPEDVSQMKEFMDNLPIANNIMDNLVPLHNMPLPVNNHMNNPVSIGDVNIHLDGSGVVDMDSMFDQLEQTQNRKRLLNCVADPLLKGNLLSKF